MPLPTLCRNRDLKVSRIRKCFPELIFILPKYIISSCFSTAAYNTFVIALSLLSNSFDLILQQDKIWCSFHEKTSHLLVGHNLLLSVPIQHPSLLRGNVPLNHVKIIWMISVGNTQMAKNLNILSHPPLRLQAQGELWVLFLQTCQMGHRIWMKITVTLTKYHLHYKVNSDFFCQSAPFCVL